ncbi:hypothetical protein [Proteus vulgaris]|uniref:hypothetical protein n=1 Tax=Proteus vulgaris TaxID=585 RepID=UPI0018CE1935|nr:hypothetical protein [Proteus vulgaris]QPN89242.1 hypothetical protein IM703_15845 [Proteus vulgaris]
MDILEEAFEVWFKKSHGYSPSVAPPDSHLIGVRRMAFEAGYRAGFNALKKERDEAIKHLILVFQQYANSDHLFMSAGEDACEFLDDLGYGIDTGRTLELTDKGKQLIKDDWE